MKFLLTCLIASGVAAIPMDWTVGQAVNTTSGTIIGHASKVDPSVSEYLGIPWGAPPTGPGRFFPPKPVAKSAEPIVAAKFGPSCPQGTGAMDVAAAGTSGPFSEDCLSLNVWTKPQSGEKKKAVLVWIYGGGFFAGSTSSPMYNGVRFAGNNDVVLVSIKYVV
jgi:cholinesterase